MPSTPCTGGFGSYMFPGIDAGSEVLSVSGFLVVVSVLMHASSSGQSRGGNCIPADSRVQSDAASADGHHEAGGCCAAAGTPAPV